MDLFATGDVRKRFRLAETPRQPAAELYHGRWRIIEAPFFAAGMLDREGPAQISINRNNVGLMSVATLSAGIDVRAFECPQEEGDCELRWTWIDYEARLPTAGCVEAFVRGNEMRGVIYVHAGDAIAFTARRTK